MKTTEYHSLKISKKSYIHNAFWLLSLDLPPALASFYSFKAGQSMPFRLSIDQEYQHRYFSVCNKPNEALQLEFMIKINENSHFLQQLHEHLLKNSSLDIGPAIGHFNLDSKPNEQRNLLALCSGIGISPIISQIDDHLTQEPGTQFHLCYGLRTPEQNPAQSYLDELKHRFGQRLNIHYFYSQWPEATPFYKGRLDKGKLKLIANQLLDWDEIDEILLCGPQAMMQTLADTALDMGIAPQNIHYESFNQSLGLSIQSRQEIPYLENIKLSYLYQNKKHELILANNQTSIAQQLINANLPVPYSCKSGVCGTCQCLVTEGDVKITDNEFLTDSEINKGYTLACTAFATQTSLNLDFDCI